MGKIRDLETVIKYGLCAGCGLCESLAGRDRIEMQIAPCGQSRPKIKATLDGETLKRILAVCPGVSVTGPARDRNGSEMNLVWGPIDSIYRAWSTDLDTRFRAAAGGALTALACFLLRSGKVDAILHVRASATDPMLTDAQVSMTEKEVISGAQSRYGPGAALVGVNELLNKGLRFAVVAKPCDIAAIRNLARIDPRVDRQILYCLSIFCGGIASLQTAQKIAAFHGLSPKKVAVFRWRGFGWPGPTHVKAIDGRIFEMPYEQTWRDPKMPWTNDVQFRCKVCPDAVGELADVTCPDGWVMEDGKPIYREAPGVNIAIARTTKGRDLLKEANLDGALALSSFDRRELDTMHYGQLLKKLQTPGRILGLTIMRQPRLRIRGYRALATFWRAGARLSWRAFFGTVIRVARRKNREAIWWSKSN